MDVLFKFIGVLLHKFGEFADSIKLKQFADCFPNTMLKGHKFQAINRMIIRSLWFVEGVIVHMNMMTA